LGEHRDVGVLDTNDAPLYAVLDEAFKPVLNDRTFENVNMPVSPPFPSSLFYPV